MDFKTLRDKMVGEQIISRGVTDRHVADAMYSIKRHLFIPKEKIEFAYQDMAVSIGEDQTISQPYMVALMTQCLAVQKDDVILEVGTGSGYQTAILASLAREVFTIERIEALSLRASKQLKELGFVNIHFHIGDGSQGILEYRGKFDAIMVTAATPKPLENLFDCLNVGGRMVVPIGDRSAQTLKLFTKDKEGIESQDICRCVFVPLLGKYGFCP